MIFCNISCLCSGRRERPSTAEGLFVFLNPPMNQSVLPIPSRSPGLKLPGGTLIANKGLQKGGSYRSEVDREIKPSSGLEDRFSRIQGSYFRGFLGGNRGIMRGDRPTSGIRNHGLLRPAQKLRRSPFFGILVLPMEETSGVRPVTGKPFPPIIPFRRFRWRQPCGIPVGCSSPEKD